MQAKRSHTFTVSGSPVTSIRMASLLGISSTALYGIANRIKSDEYGKIQAAYKESLKNARGNTIEWNGVETLTKDVAKELGLKESTLDRRIAKWGPDCCWTYFPGPVPRDAFPRKEIVRDGSCSWGDAGNDEWKAMSDKPKNHNLSRIHEGSWERMMPCPPPGTGSSQDYHRELQ